MSPKEFILKLAIPLRLSSVVTVVTELGAQGICISAGSACHRGQLSHVYRAMGLDKKAAAGVQQGTGLFRFQKLRDLGHGEDAARLVVGEHHRDECGVVAQCTST